MKLSYLLSLGSFSNSVLKMTGNWGLDLWKEV